MPRVRPALVAAAIALSVVAADQASKAWAEGSLEPGHQVTVIHGWLWFRLATNTGATLGLLSGHNWLFAASSLLVVAAVAVLVVRGSVSSLLGMIALGAVAGGAIGNLADRVRFGRVIDFIEVRFWPTDFNLADAAIRLGVVLLLLALLLDLRRRSRSGDGANRAT